MTTETPEQTVEKQAKADSMIQQLMGDAQIVQGDPGAVPPVYSSDGLSHMNLPDPVPAITTVADTAGSAWVWHMKTYKAVPVNLNMLPDQLRKKDDQGRPLFTVYGPEDDRSPIKGMYPHVGIHKCLLHPDSERRTYYNTLGLPVCLKSTIPSPYEVTQHMRTKHEQEWKGIEQQQERTEKAEDRALQREIMGRAGGDRSPAPQPSPTTASGDLTLTPEAPEATKHGHKRPEKPKKMQALACEVCAKVFRALTEARVKNKLKKHMKEEHPDG